MKELYDNASKLPQLPEIVPKPVGKHTAERAKEVYLQERQTLHDGISNKSKMNIYSDMKIPQAPD